MAKRVVIVGAVALGPKVAARVMRLDPGAEVKLLDRDYIISYGGCGIPYYIGGDVADLEGLRSTSAHVLRDSRFFKNAKCVDVLHAEALAIDRRAKTLKIRHQTDGQEDQLPYDKLVLATGATPVQPPLPGVDLPGVSLVANLHQAKAIKEMIAKGQVENAVVIGGGAIGLEMAEALTDLWGVETTLVEMMDQLLPPAFGPDMALLIKNHMTEKGVRVLLSERVTRILGDAQNGVQAVETSTGQIPCQLVILAVGVRPNSTLAREAGLAVGRFGGIRVDEGLRTSDPDIFAGGDCIEILHRVSGGTVHMPLGSLANRQGRVIGTNITGGWARIGGTVGSFCLKVFDLGIARAGLTERQATAAGFDPAHAVVVQSDRAHFYPSQELMYLKLIADRKTRRVLGIEAVGKAGDAVKGRVDAVAALMHHDVGLAEISNLEVAYAPPFASAMDIVNNAANALENILEGRQEPIDVAEFLKEFKDGKIRVLDVRSAVQSSPFMEKYGSQWLNIPQEELVCRLDEVPKGERLCLICGSGPRSYEAQLLLRSRGIGETRNIQGGVGMVKLSDPDFAPSE
ncbi:MAG: FAD-dependent oxidoreductase [Desulfobacteraceae bacterium]|jgi:NADPH-dependent 2,4-dienoyl-CoA reductase/sulfur reductase-like enzyme/rhodanese-related sulfurtransferase